MYKCVIIDDEPIARRIIKNHLSNFKDFQIVEECSNAPEATPVLSKQKIDLLFCDIRMPQITGVEFIRSLAHPPRVIFTTAFRDYAIDAFDLNVVDYLLKPISFERFTQAINKYFETTGALAESSPKKTVEAPKNQDYIFLKSDKKLYKVDLNEILWIESLGDYILVFTSEGKITTKERIGTMVEMLSPDKFIRIHRSFIVSIAKINTIGPGFVEVEKKKIPIGRSYKKEINFLININSR